MKYAVIDTEGSGLFDFKLPADHPSQPRLAALGMILLKEDLSVDEVYSALVKPDGWSMHPDATKVNGLTDEILHAQGKPVAEVLGVYAQAIKEGFAIVAFNAQHDCKTMRAEFRRAGMPDLFEQTKNICVMRKANGVILKANGKKGWPTLAECRTFLGLANDGAHTAGADASAALAVFRYLLAQGVDLTPEVHYAKAKPGAVEEEGALVPPPAELPSAPISRPRAAAAAPVDEIPR